MSEQAAEYSTKETPGATETTSAAAEIPAQAVNQQQQSVGAEAARSNAAIGTAQGQPEGAGNSSGAADPAVAAEVSSVSTPAESPASSIGVDTTGLNSDQLGRLRDTLIAANPDAVPEMIAGADFDSLLGSMEGAKAAFARIKAGVQAGAAGSVHRGGGARTPDSSTYASLSPAAKIAVGIEMAANSHP